MPRNDPSRDPSTVSDSYATMLPVWGKISTVLAGTDAMRAAGERYLPRHHRERARHYNERLAGATMTTLPGQVLDAWVGKPFSKPVTVTEEVPERIVEILEDADLLGNPIGVVARNWFKSGLANALSHVFVDFPSLSEEEREERSRADDIEENRRPYLTLVAPEDLIFAATEVVNSREILTHVRIKVEEPVVIGFAERRIQRIRSYTRLIDPDTGVPFVAWEVYRLQETGKEKGWVLEEGPYRMDIDEIPLVTFYVNRDGLMHGKPPLEGVIDLGISHWQSTSDQRTILTVTRFPLLAGSGVSEEESKAVLSPKKLLYTENPDGKWYYVEHDGAAIEQGWRDLERLEDQMRAHGAEYLRKRPGDVTATARALDEAESTSPLQDAAIRFEESLNHAVWLMAKWLGIEMAGKVQIRKDFGPDSFLTGDLKAVGEARKGRDLSRRKYLAELQRHNALAEDFDYDENDAELEAETMDGEATIDIDEEQGEEEGNDEE